MKRGIEVYTDYDEKGRFTHYVKKRKGKLTLEEIREALREYEEDYYLKKYFKGKITPRSDNLQLLADALNVEVADLFLPV